MARRRSPRQVDPTFATMEEVMAAWSVWARSGEPSLVDLVAGRRTIVFDTGSLSDARERSVVALALLGRLRARRKAPTRLLEH